MKLSSIHIKNAVTSGIVGIVVFTLLVWWSPLKHSLRGDVGTENAKSEYTVVGIDADDPNWRFSGGLTEKSKENMGPDALKKLCSASASYRKNPVAYAELRKILAAGGNKKEGDNYLNTLDKLEAIIDKECIDGKPRP